MRRLKFFLAFLLIAAGVATLGPKLIKRWSVHAQTGVMFSSQTYASYQFHVLKYPTGLSFNAASSATFYNGLCSYS